MEPDIGERSVPNFAPTPYKISTITATGSLNTSLALDSLFRNIPVLAEDDNKTVNGIIYVEFGKKKSDTIHRGRPKKLSVTRRAEGKKRFDNQVTIVYRSLNGTPKPARINAKIFKNGNIQMTGLRFIEQGTQVIDYIVNIIRTIHSDIDDNIVENFDDLRNTDYRVRLINCDFRIGFEIKREKLHKVMLAGYRIPCTYEPCIYPGVKVQYWWNDDHFIKNGCCDCSAKCNGKGCGSGNGACKKITIAIFQSGCIIITGGQSLEQIDEAYEFICNFIDTHKVMVQKIVAPLPDITPCSKKKILIKKCDVRTCMPGITS